MQRSIVCHSGRVKVYKERLKKLIRDVVSENGEKSAAPNGKRKTGGVGEQCTRVSHTPFLKNSNVLLTRCRTLCQVASHHSTNNEYGDVTILLL